MGKITDHFGELALCSQVQEDVHLHITTTLHGITEIKRASRQHSVP